MMINELAAETGPYRMGGQRWFRRDCASAQSRLIRQNLQIHSTEVDKYWVKNLDMYSQRKAACAYVNCENSYGVITIIKVLAQTRQDNCLNRPQLRCYFANRIKQLPLLLC